jgi:glycosyltransferase involved in cell wall biosynthesis
MADRLLFDSLAVKDYFIEYLSGDEYKRYAPVYKDAVQLKEAIEKYIKNPDIMKKEALSGFERANRLFKADISVNRIISIYESIYENMRNEYNKQQ